MDVNYPGSQEDLVSNWDPAFILVEDDVSGAKIAPCCLWLLTPASLPLVGDGPVHSSSLVFAQSFVLCAGWQGLSALG